MLERINLSSFLVLFIVLSLGACKQKTSSVETQPGRSNPNSSPISQSSIGNDQGTTPFVIPTPELDTGVVTGQLSYSGTDDPVMNNTLYLGFKIYLTPGPDYTYGFTQHGSPRVTTDDEGRFAIGGIIPGTYIVLLWSLSGTSMAHYPESNQELEINVEAGKLLDLGRIEVNPLNNK
jgi:hypothetical protein